MDRKLHAWLARSLIDACGGLHEAEQRCRLAKSRLSECQDPNPPREGQPPAYLPADVIAELEAYCGQPIYSRALLENQPGHVDAKGLLTEACELTEEAGAMQRLVRLAQSHRSLNRGQREALMRGLATIDREFRELRFEVEAEVEAAP